MLDESRSSKGQLAREISLLFCLYVSLSSALSKMTHFILNDKHKYIFKDWENYICHDKERNMSVLEITCLNNETFY